MSSRRTRRRFQFPPGEAQLPRDFGERLTTLKQRSGLTWEQMAEALGVDERQLQRWRRGACPNGRSMFSLIRMAARVPGGVNDLLGNELRAGDPVERSR